MVSAAFHNVLVRRYDADLHSYNYNSVEVCLPGSTVPRQFTYQTKKSSSITVQVPSHSNFLGFLYSVVLSPSHGMKKHGAKIRCQCYEEGCEKVTSHWHDKAISELKSDHVYIWYDPFHCDYFIRFYETEVCFEFSVTTDTGEVDFSNGIKECGVHLISVSELHSVLLELELDSDKRKDMEEELGLDSGHNTTMTSKELHPHVSEDLNQVQIPSPPIPPPPPPKIMKKEISDEKESNGKSNQISNQQRDLSEQSSYGWKFVIEQSKSLTVETDTRSTDHFSDEEKSVESASKETKTGDGRGHEENYRESTEAVKSEGNEGTPTESEARLHLPIDSVDKENVSEDILIENYYSQPNNVEEAKQSEENQSLPGRQLIVHHDIHDLTVEEPYLERENEQMGLDKPKSQDDSDEDPLAELETILLGSQNSSSKAASSTNDIAIRGALHNLECLLEKSLDNILGDVELQRQLQISLQCIEQASDEKVSPSIAKLVKNMTSSIEDLFKNFALTQKVVEDHTSRLQQKEKLVQQMVDARKQQELLKEKMNQYKFQAESLDREAEDLDEKIRLLVEQKKLVQMEQTKLKEALEECNGEKKKLKDEAKNWVAESKELMLAINNSELSYAAAMSKQEKLNDKWEGFRTSLAHNFKTLS